MNHSEKKKSGVGPTHAGAIVYKVTEGKIEYLLVRPNSGANEWLFPKGHIEEGEDIEDCALRELKEETGVVAEIVEPLPTLEFEAKRKFIRCKFFLLQFVHQAESSEKRAVKWAHFDAALSLISHKGNRNLLRSAEQQRQALISPSVEV